MIVNPNLSSPEQSRVNINGYYGLRIGLKYVSRKVPFESQVVIFKVTEQTRCYLFNATVSHTPGSSPTKSFGVVDDALRSLTIQASMRQAQSFEGTANPALRTRQEIINIPLKTCSRCACIIGREMPDQELKQFLSVFAEPEGRKCRIVIITFRVENESDAIEVAEDIAILEDAELIYLSRC